MFNAANEVAVAAFLDGKLPFLGIAEVVEEALAAADGSPVRDLAELVEVDAEARRLGGARSARRMNIFVAILGLGFLILIHEAGHFFVARAVGMNPRKFYLGFPPAIAKTKRNGIEYGVGAVPLGGYVKIPGMHRPAAGDLDMHFGRAVEEQPSLRRPVERAASAARGERLPGALEAVRALAQALEEAELSPSAAKAAERGVGDIEDALAPDAYWRAKTWKRVAVIFAGPAREPRLRDCDVHRPLHGVELGLPPRLRAASRRTTRSSRRSTRSPPTLLPQRRAFGPATASSRSTASQ